MISVPLSDNEGQVTGPVQGERTLWIRTDLTLSEWKCTSGCGDVGGEPRREADICDVNLCFINLGDSWNPEDEWVWGKSVEKNRRAWRLVNTYFYLALFICYYRCV